MTRLLALALALALSVCLAAPAHAGDDERGAGGTCSGSSDWKLKVKTDDGGLEVEAEVDSNVVGQTWRFTLRQNGDVIAQGRKQTRGPSGSFDVERQVEDTNGADVFKLRAKNPSTDEVCVGRLSY